MFAGAGPGAAENPAGLGEGRPGADPGAATGTVAGTLPKLRHSIDLIETGTANDISHSPFKGYYERPARVAAIARRWTTCR